VKDDPQIALLAGIGVATCAGFLYRTNKQRQVLTLLKMALLLASGRYRLLWEGFDWPWVPLGLLGGQIAFVVSVALVRASPRAALNHALPIRAFMPRGVLATVVGRYLLISAFEEVFWRGTVQSLLGGYQWAILASSAFFVLSHLPRSPAIRAIEAAELFLFSCMLGCLFLWSHSVHLVTVVHAVRNMNLWCIRYAAYRQRRRSGGSKPVSIGSVSQ
jgi:membrane protease YdiL (CAAX protease family)